MKKTIILILVISIYASAHFQLVYTPEVETSAKQVNFLLFFTHPFEGDPVMKTGLTEKGKVLGIEKAFVVHKEKTRDLTTKLKKITFTTKTDKGPAFSLTLDNTSGYKSGGDYAIVVVPFPYWEPAENLYIQQITKVFINKGGFTTDWDKRCAKNYTEILPLVNPFDIISGSLFRGVVVDNSGKPVSGVVVEVEYLNFGVDMNKKMLTNNPTIKNEKKGVATLITDKSGVFAYIPQLPGFWGFAALSAGSQKTYKGKELEQDPVIWIKVTPNN